nr:hypothetical protein [Tanacetum cinerariifolium]
MFKSSSYKSLPEHVALYEALEASIERENNDEFLVKKEMSRKRRRDDQDPPPPPDSHLSKKKRHDYDVSRSKQPPISYQVIQRYRGKQASEQNWRSGIVYQMVLQKDRKEEANKIEECHRLLTDQVDLVNPKDHRLVHDVSKPLTPGCPPSQ